MRVRVYKCNVNHGPKSMLQEFNLQAQRKDLSNFFGLHSDPVKCKCPSGLSKKKIEVSFTNNSPLIQINENSK